MTLELALRLLEIGLGLAALQRGIEHARRDVALFAPQILAAAALIWGGMPALACAALWLCAVAQLIRFEGPYNGGSDKMLLLALTCLLVARLVPAQAELALAYLAVQIVLSYFISGWVKLRNADWRSGAALSDVFAVSAYPVSEALRRLALRRRLMRSGSWGVIGFEVAFPAVLVLPGVLPIALGVAALFHLANAALFGLNRFVWAWVATYPALFWFQGRILGI